MVFQMIGSVKLGLATCKRSRAKKLCRLRDVNWLKMLVIIRSEMAPITHQLLIEGLSYPTSLEWAVLIKVMVTHEKVHTTRYKKQKNK